MRSGLRAGEQQAQHAFVSTCVLPVPALALTQAEALRIGGFRLSFVVCLRERRCRQTSPVPSISEVHHAVFDRLGRPFRDARQVRVVVVVVVEAGRRSAL